MSRARSGIALVMALVVLAALLLLALPFLFSQTASLAGARHAGWHGTGQRARDAADQYGTAVTAYSAGYHLSPEMDGSLRPSSWIGDLRSDAGIPGPPPAGSRFEGIIDQAFPGSALAAHGCVIDDEHGKLDANSMGPFAWAQLLNALQITDPQTFRWVWTTDGSLPVGDINHWGRWVAFTTGAGIVPPGRLAVALSRWRAYLASGRYTELEQLLTADPGFGNGTFPIGTLEPSDGTGHALGDPVSQIAHAIPDWKDQTRHLLDQQGPWRQAHLTRAELARLATCLTTYTLAQGRSGLADLGTSLGASPLGGGETSDAVEDGHGIPWGWYVSLHLAGNSLGFTQAGDSSWITGASGTALDPLAAELPVAVNLNSLTATSPVAKALLWGSSGAPGLTLATLPGLAITDPGRGDGTTRSLMPPGDVASNGIITIDAAGAGLDPLGQSQSLRRSRTVVQAVPQERPLERHWTTQADLAVDLALDRASAMVSGPHPVNRLTDFATSATAVALLDTPGWLEPAPLGSWSLNPAADCDWRATFGLAGACDRASVLLPETRSGNTWTRVVAGPVLPATSWTATAADPGPLGPQGVSLGGSNRLAYPLADGGMLRFHPTGVVTDEASPRQISLRFRLDGPASTSTTIVEARHYDPASLGTAPASDDQFLWRVRYEPTATQPMLVLDLANAALPVTADSAETMSEDLPETPLVDERCFAIGKPATPHWPGSGHVEFRYALTSPLAAGTWHQLQVIIASEQPGLHALVLDGIVGRDALVSGSFARTGDHYTFPSLRLKQGADIDPSDPLAHGSGDLVTADIAVTPPPGLHVSDVLPQRGIVRIDDEFFSYAGIDDAAGTLTEVQRGRRILTDQGAMAPPGVDADGHAIPAAPLDRERWPITQGHAAGALVVPGWTQVQLPGTWTWLRGGGGLVDGIPEHMATGTVDVAAGPIGTSLTLHPDVGATWPRYGYIALQLPDSSWARAAYSLVGGTSLTLNWDPADPAIQIDPALSFATAATLDVRQISIAIDQPAANRFAGWFQVSAPTIGCEWLRLDYAVDRELDGAQHHFLVNVDSWADPPTPTVATANRNCMRSGDPAQAKRVWPVGATVMPVQHPLPYQRFEDGDAVTLVQVAGATPAIIATPMVVRHATRDGFPAVPTDSGEIYRASPLAAGYFAFTTPVPDQVADVAQSAPVNPVPTVILVGRGWNGADLSVHRNASFRRGQMACRAGWSDNGTVGGAGAAIFVGCSQAGSTTGITVDDLTAGSLAVGDPDQAGIGQGCAVTDIGPDALLPWLVRTNQQIFTRPYGLVLFDGEVFAYRRIANDEAHLIARGLLGSAVAPHVIPVTGVNVPINYVNGAPVYTADFSSLPILPLPIGPVAELLGPDAGGDALAATAAATRTGFAFAPGSQSDPLVWDGTYDALRDAPLPETQWQRETGISAKALDAPVQLICDPLDGSSELVRLIRGPDVAGQVATAPWLRGLYDTPVRAWTPAFGIVRPPGPWGATTASTPPRQAVPAWSPPATGSGTLNPIVIGWWPRQAAPMRDLGLTGRERDAQLRCRTYGWASLAMRLHGCRFDASAMLVRSATAPLIAGADATASAGVYFDVHALAAGTGVAQMADWGTGGDRCPHLGAGVGLDFTRAFGGATTPTWDRFANAETDGAELRIQWGLSSSGAGLEAAAAAQGCAVRIANPVLRCLAPVRILDLPPPP